MSDMRCRECGNETSAPPDDAPPDWHGLCPRCAFKALSEDRISSPGIGFLLNALTASLEDAEECLICIQVGGEDDPRSRMDLSMLDDHQVVYIHRKDDCQQAVDSMPCPFHAPSNHHMQTWPMHGNAGLTLPLIERVCEHNAPHPDPDSLAWCLKQDPTFNAYHGACDGCCKP